VAAVELGAAFVAIGLAIMTPLVWWFGERPRGGWPRWTPVALVITFDISAVNLAHLHSDLWPFLAVAAAAALVVTVGLAIKGKESGT